MKRLTILIAIIVIGLNNNCDATNSELSQEPLNILFIGSSYFNTDCLPKLFNNLADSSNKEVYIDQYVISGLYLYDHAHSIIAEAKINEKDWDYVVLQGVGSVTAYPEYYTAHPVFSALATLQNKISSNCKTTKLVFCLPWAFEDGMTWMAGWTDLYYDMQIKMYNNSLQYSNNLGLIIAPVGWAWYQVLEEKNYPLHYLHSRDWNHPSIKGSFLMACVIYSTIFQESSIDIPYFGGLQNEETDYFQEIASNIVLNDLNLWNITNTIIDLTELSVNNSFYLYQNYPNPVYSEAQINYETKKAGFLEISLYDNFGNKYANLVNEYKLPGNYSVRFDGSSIPSGIYYYSLRKDSEYITRKMILANSTLRS
ncbi:MAG: T9SS type A sorting domain-containing protein [Bacteroidales bacterium]|nr:T9SS type A sorting domain-containing protein [Bacteroidales bacterium]